MALSDHLSIDDLLPVPERDADSGPHWDALEDHRLVLQSCGNCQRVRYPAMAHCPYCASSVHSWRELSGEGTVYSWIVVRQAFWPEFASEVPYSLVSVDLAEGVRVVARIDDLDSLAFGLRVQAEFVTHPAWVELRFSATQTTPSPLTRSSS